MLGERGNRNSVVRTHKNTAVRGHIRKAVVYSANAAVVQTTWSMTIVYFVIWKIHRVGVVYAGETGRFTRLA